MELLIITAVKTFEKKVKKLLQEHSVTAYSYSSVIGFRKPNEQEQISNWFGSEVNEIDSLLFFAFVTENTANRIMEAVKEENKKCEVQSKIHLAVTPITKHN